MDHLYSDSNSKRLFKITQKIIFEESLNPFYLFLSFQTEINEIVDRFYEFLNSTEEIAFWCKINICFNIICLKNFVFDLFKLRSPGFLKNKPTYIETKYNMERVMYFCGKENLLYNMFINDNHNFYFYFFDTYTFKKVEIDELEQYMSAYLDIKMCCNILMLYFRE